MNEHRTRLFDLMADVALGCLHASDRREFDRLLAEHRDVPTDTFTSTVARIDLAVSRFREDEMPLAVSERIATRGREWVLTRQVGRKVPGRGAYFLALAAAVVLVIGAFFVLLDASGSRSAPLDERDRLQQFLVKTRDLVRGSFGPGPDPGGAGARVAGEVAWSPSQQRGYLCVRGLPKNDPKSSCYQLWIFDRERDERYPVDGGVFDCGEDEVVVPIDAKIRVGEPTLFAVTVEPAGGVVVSARERIVAIAQP